MVASSAGPGRPSLNAGSVNLGPQGSTGTSRCRPAKAGRPKSSVRSQFTVQTGTFSYRRQPESTKQAMQSAKRAARLPATIRRHKSGRPQLSRSSLDTCAAPVSSKSWTAISGTLSRPDLLTPTPFPISRPNIAGGVYITTEGGRRTRRSSSRVPPSRPRLRYALPACRRAGPRGKSRGPWW